MAKEQNNDSAATTISVELIRATSEAAQRQTLRLPAGATVAAAIAASRFAGERSAAVAVHGELASPQRPLDDGDRIELLRELLIDPMQARRDRSVADGR